MWSKKFLAVAEKREYQAILEKDQEELSIDQPEQKKQNSMAYNDLMLAMTEDLSFGLVDEAVGSIYLEGDERSAWGRLMQ